MPKRMNVRIFKCEKCPEILRLNRNETNEKTKAWHGSCKNKTVGGVIPRYIEQDQEEA